VSLVVKGKVDCPSRKAPGVPRDFDTIVLKGLSSDPTRRFATARAIARWVLAESPAQMPVRHARRPMAQQVAAAASAVGQPAALRTECLCKQTGARRRL